MDFMAKKHDVEEDNEITSAYNTAQFEIMRLNDSWITCKENIRRGNLYAWKVELDNIWLELSGDAIRLAGEDESVNKYYIKKVLFEKAISISVKNKHYGTLRKILLKYSEFLFQLQQLAGKGSKYRDKQEEHII